jgi:hypothetical protein
MKKNVKYSIILLAFFSCCNGFGQIKVIDSLIQKITNNDAYIVLVKTMSPRINSDAGNRIIMIGKEATPELIKILDNQNQGIIAHFILSKIWKENWNEEACCAILSNGKVEIIIINGLKIYIENNTLYSKIDDLKNNKEKWKKLLES